MRVKFSFIDKNAGNFWSINGSNNPDEWVLNELQPGSSHCPNTPLVCVLCVCRSNVTLSSHEWMMTSLRPMFLRFYDFKPETEPHSERSGRIVVTRRNSKNSSLDIRKVAFNDLVRFSLLGLVSILNLMTLTCTDGVFPPGITAVRMVRWHVSDDIISACPHPLSVNPVYLTLTTHSNYLIHANEANVGGYVIGDSISTYVFNSSITCILSLFVPQGEMKL